MMQERCCIMSFDELLDETIKLSETKNVDLFVDKATELYKRNRLNLWANYLYAYALQMSEQWLESYEIYSVLYQL